MNETEIKRMELDSLRVDIANLLEDARELCIDYNLASMNKFTLIARDPSTPNMCVIVSNDDNDILDKLENIYRAGGEEWTEFKETP